jgi:hypothetical protein
MFPLPGTTHAVVAVPAPGGGFGNWAGAPSAALAVDGTYVVAYRVRTAEQRGAAVVVALSDDGERLATVATVDKDRFGAESLERPAIVRTERGWRLYVCCATPGSKHWWIDVLEADDPAALPGADARTVFPGDEHGPAAGRAPPPLLRGAAAGRQPRAAHRARLAVVVDGLDVVAVGIEHERGEVARVVLGPLTRLAVVAVPGVRRGAVERLDGLVV